MLIGGVADENEVNVVFTLPVNAGVMTGNAESDVGVSHV